MYGWGAEMGKFYMYLPGSFINKLLLLGHNKHASIAFSTVATWAFHGKWSLEWKRALTKSRPNARHSKNTSLHLQGY
jgi:hypothetical protein